MHRLFLLWLLFFSVILPGSSWAYQEVGMASWYSDTFHNRKTASGERYDKNKLTGAHNTLPFGTKVRVTRLDNGKSVVITINDRGPHIRGRIVDLSRKAAEKIGLIDDGVTKVRLTTLHNKEKSDSHAGKGDVGLPEIVAREVAKMQEEQPPAKVPATAPQLTEQPPAPVPVKQNGQLVTGSTFQDFSTYQVSVRKPEKGGFGVQVASLKDYRNVLRQIAILQEKWGDRILLRIEGSTEHSFIYKLIIGPYLTKAEAVIQKERIQKQDKMDGFIIDLNQ